MEVCYIPFSMEKGCGEAGRHATLAHWCSRWTVKVAAALPHICADFRSQTLAEAWQAYRDAWHDASVLLAIRRAIADESRHADANTWQLLPVAQV
jgi:hypothetical protein